MFELVHHQQHFGYQPDETKYYAPVQAPQPLQVIQLIEVDTLPPSQTSVGLSSYASDFSSSSEEESSSDEGSYADSDESGSEEEYLEEEDEEEEEDECTSYCSSDEMECMPEEDAKRERQERETRRHDPFASKMRSILHWREHQFDAALWSKTDSEAPASLKRKVCEESDDCESHTSKRSRSATSSSSRRSISSAELEMHPCPACDAFFATEESLRAHGKDKDANEACWVAVEYAFEK